MGYYGTIKSFDEISSKDAEIILIKQIKEEIDNKEKEFILGIDEIEYKKNLIERNKIDPLKIFTESKKVDVDKQGETYIFTVRYNYTGSAFLFKVRPSSRTVVSNKIVVTDDFVSFSFKLYNKDEKEFKRQKANNYRNAFINLDNVNKFAEVWNGKLLNIVNSYFQQQKKKYLEENDFFAAINLKIDDDTESVLTVPIVKKKVIPQPTISQNRELLSEDNIMQQNEQKKPKVFISYSYDGKQHEQWVENFAKKLKENNINVILDKWHTKLGQPLTNFMEQSISNSQRVICILTPNYKNKTDKLNGGVGYEYSIITAEIFQSVYTTKFIPLLRNGSEEDAIPISLSGRKYLDMTNDEDFDKNMNDLLNCFMS